MCRSIKRLREREVMATEDEIRAAALQFVRKVSGFSKPTKAHEAVFAAAVDEIAASSARLLEAVTSELGGSRPKSKAIAFAGRRGTEPASGS